MHNDRVEKLTSNTTLYLVCKYKFYLFENFVFISVFEILHVKFGIIWNNILETLNINKTFLLRFTTRLISREISRSFNSAAKTTCRFQIWNFFLDHNEKFYTINQCIEKLGFGWFQVKLTFLVGFSWVCFFS